ncbi:MAG: DUF6067 family protein [Kiritimatiellae bacterium]|nr:DUF6067 family protein [Kiritimatiellia bacterium]
MQRSSSSFARWAPVFLLFFLLAIRAMTEPVTNGVASAVEWADCRLGLGDTVLAPWTPLQVRSEKRGILRRHSETVVHCWGRAYRFDERGLPAQIVSKEAELLAAPVSLRLQLEGKSITWSQSKSEIVSSSPASVEIAGAAEAAPASGEIALQTRLRLEYDGLIVYRLRLVLPKKTSADSLVLDIPMRSETVLYRHRQTMADLARCIPGTTVGGALPSGEGIVDSSTFIPYAWLGDNDRGLFWFCESAEHWPNWANSNAVETVREGDRTVLRLNLLQPGQTLPSDWEFEFGLQATPAKPMPPQWRNWRWWPAAGATQEIVLSGPKPNAYYGYPGPEEEETFTKSIADRHAKGRQGVFYSLIHMMDETCPEFKRFGQYWHAGEGMGDASVHLRSICPRAGEKAEWKYSDFIVWKNHEYIRKYKLDGFYHDCVGPTYCMRDGQGHEQCSWRDAAGKRHCTIAILAWRDIYRRMYAMVKATSPDFFLVTHMSPYLTMPILAYEDAYLDGEHLRRKVRDDYLDVLPLDTFRAEFMGRQWGVAPIFIPEFLDPAISAKVEPTRGLAALLMLHDVTPWPAYSNVKVFNEMFAALDAFGYAEAEFIPYFDAKPPATADMRDVYVSVYKRGDSRALAVVGNLSKEDRQGSIRLSSRRIGLPLDRIVSWPDRAPVARSGDRIELAVPRQGYRMLLIED